MGIFEWLPTLDEVEAFIWCRLDGHDWKPREDGSQVCAECGKVRQIGEGEE